MAANSKIEWTHHTFNPWRGCTKVAAGCANCYADSQAKRNPGTLGIWGDNGTRVVASEAMWREPIKWNTHTSECQMCGHWNHPSSKLCQRKDCVGTWDDFLTKRPRVFCASMADVFEDWGDNGVVNSHGFFAKDYQSGKEGVTLDDVRRRLFALIDATPNLDWLLLTKRPENIRRMWVDEKIPWRATGRWHRDNVWLGTSIATQADADRNVPELLKCRDLSPVLFVSAEPLLGPVDLASVQNGDALRTWSCRHESHDSTRVEARCDGVVGHRASIDWVIAGGESGPHARPMHPDWARSLRDQCQAAGVPFFFKQWGEYIPDGQEDLVPNGFSCVPEIVEHNGQAHGVFRVGKKLAGRNLDGREWNEFPMQGK